MMTFRSTPLLLMLSLGCAASQDSALVTIDTLPGGVVRTMNHGPSEWSDTNGWKLVLDKTIQPAQGSAGELVNPRHLLLRADGSFVVMESDPPEFKLYDAAGEFVRTIGREGEGPREYRRPHPVLLGDTLIIQDPQLSRLSLVTIDDSLVREFPSLCCNYGPRPTVDSNGRIGITAGSADPTDRAKQQWTYFSLTGERVDSLVLPTLIEPATWTVTRSNSGEGFGTTTYSIPLAAYNSLVHLADGSIIYGETGSQRFLVTTDGIDTVAIFGRDDLIPDPAPASLRDSLFDLFTGYNDDLKSIARKGDLPATLSTWTGITEDGTGNFWVATGGDGRPRAFDVYSSEGILLGAVARPWQSGRSESWAGDRVAIFDYDDNDLPVVRIYRIER